MEKRMPDRNVLLCLIALLLTALLAACAPPVVPTPPPGAVTLPPALTPHPTPTDSIPLPSPTSPPTSVAEAIGLLGQLPYPVTDEEALAAAAGIATYSGYACVTTPDGCACELPELREMSITFLEDETARLIYYVDDVSQGWDLVRLAPNQWEYSAPLVDQEDMLTIGEVRIMYSFIPEGYVYSQVTHFYESGLVACPEVTFRRID
jgi:hypothetical protein